MEGKQFYFSFGSFSTQGSINLDLKSRFNFLACATPWFFLNSSYKLVKHCAKTYVRTGLGNLILASDEPSELEQILSEI